MNQPQYMPVCYDQMFLETISSLLAAHRWRIDHGRTRFVRAWYHQIQRVARQGLARFRAANTNDFPDYYENTPEGETVSDMCTQYAYDEQFYSPLNNALYQTANQRDMVIAEHHQQQA